MSSYSHSNFFCLLIEDSVTEEDQNELLARIARIIVGFIVYELSRSSEQAKAYIVVALQFYIVLVNGSKLICEHMLSAFVNNEHVVWLFPQNDNFLEFRLLLIRMFI